MKISIIIPAYNCETLIGQCLDSVLAQTGAELEVIVVNDGSTDRTGEILANYGDAIRLITVPNGGVSKARNMGLSLASGDYVLFADADDSLKEGAVERLVRLLTETDADIIKFTYHILLPDGTVKIPYNQFEAFDVIEKKDFKQKIYPHFIRGIRLNSLWSGIYRRTLLEGLSFREDMRTAEDAVFLLDVYTRAQTVAVIPDALYNYYQTGEGLTGSAASVFMKYRCNMILASQTISHLKEWDMDGVLTRFRTYLRPVLLTFDKLKRLKQKSV